MAVKSSTKDECLNQEGDTSFHQKFVRPIKDNKTYFLKMLVIGIELMILFLEILLIDTKHLGYVVLATVMCIVCSVGYILRHTVYAYVAGNNEAFDNMFAGGYDKTVSLKDFVRNIFEKKGFKIDKEADLSEYIGDLVMKNDKEVVLFQILDDSQVIDSDLMKEMVISMWNFRANKGYFVVDSLTNCQCEAACSSNVEIIDKKILEKIVFSRPKH